MNFPMPKRPNLSFLAVILAFTSVFTLLPGQDYRGPHRIDFPSATVLGAFDPGSVPERQELVQPLSSTDLTSATEITPEIEELARGLMHDPELIFEFVLNNIDYTHYFGCKKGATLTLLERSGNDYDQSALLVALLRASGYTAVFQEGLMAIPVDCDYWSEIRCGRARKRSDLPVRVLSYAALK